MAMKNRLGGHTNSYHTYSLEEALEGIAAAGFKYVELISARGWTEHVPLDADAKTLGKIQRMLHRLDLIPMSLSGTANLTTKEGVQWGMMSLELCERLGIDIMNTPIGGHSSEHEDEGAFMANIHELADYAAERDIMIGLEIHGDIASSGKKAVPLIEKINRKNVRINYDTANVEFYGGIPAEKDMKYALPYMVHCHMKDHIGGAHDWNFPAIGKGQIDFEKILSIMKKGKFSGPLSVEIEFTAEGWPPLAKVNKAMKQSYKHLASLGLS